MLLALPVHGGEGSNTYGETCQRRTQDGSAYDNGCPFSARTFHCRRLFNTDERTNFGRCYNTTRHDYERRTVRWGEIPFPMNLFGRRLAIKSLRAVPWASLLLRGHQPRGLVALRTLSMSRFVNTNRISLAVG
jgi:hypothetical protein